MEGIVKDLSFVGKTTSKIGFIISIVIGVILLYFSYSFFTKTDDFIKVKGTIKNVKECKERTEIQTKARSGTFKTENYYDCIITVEYNVNNKVYTNDILTNNKINYMKYNTQTLEISYNPKNPNEIKLPSMPSKTVAVIFLLIAFAIVGVGYYSNYLAQKSTIISASQGINSVASVFGLNNRRY